MLADDNRTLIGVARNRFSVLAEDLAAEYNRRSLAQDAPILARELPSSPAHFPLKLLDLGCANGAMALQLAQQRNFDVTGVDACGEFIAMAHDAVRAAKDENPYLRVQFIRDELPSLQRLRTREIKDKYDVVVMKDVLGYITPEERAEFLGGIRDLLNPGAMLFVSAQTGESTPGIPALPVRPENVMRELGTDQKLKLMLNRKESGISVNNRPVERHYMTFGYNP